MGRTLRYIPLAALASVALAACGSSSSSSSSSSQAAAAATTPTSSSGPVLVKTASSPTLHTTVLTNAQGMTLYHLSGETGGRFICTSAACVQVWHPVTVTTASTPNATVSLATVKRPDGTLQVTYKGAPLYTFSGDKAAGEDRGQGIKDVGTWSAATTEEGASQAASAPTTTTSSSSSGSGGSESSGSGGYGY